MTAKHLARRIVLSAVTAAMLPASAFAGDGLLPNFGPVPSLRPMAAAPGVAVDPARFGAAPAQAAPFSDVPAPLLRPASSKPVPALANSFTASIASMAPRLGTVSPMNGSLKDGLQALSDGNAVRARAIRESFVPGSLDRHILEWAIALSGDKNVPAIEVARAASDLSDWPGVDTLRVNSERALWRENRPAGEVIGVFRGATPQSPEGAMALARAFISVGNIGNARQLVAKVWRTERFDAKTEKNFLDTFQSLLTRADHKARMDMLLYSERVGDASRVAGLAGKKQLFAARAAVIRNDSNARSLLAAVPANDRSDPGYRLAMIEYNRKNDKVAEAAKLLMGAPRDEASLVNPDAWWNERRIVARDLLDLGQSRLAYQVSAGHAALSPAEAAEAEFHAGWIALRFVGDSRAAAAHFARIVQLSGKPLSLSRGYYWLGRAADAGGGGSAAGYYGRAAHYGATFYGQLAAARLGRRPDPIAFPRPSTAERQRFDRREAVRAIRRLEEIGSDWRADILYRSLANELTSPGELALLSVMAERRGDHHLVLQVGKQAYWRGIDAPALAFPIGVIPDSANISAAGKALAYAVARQESAFNPQARSAVGAIGLLQLMPGTAKAVARSAGMSYSPARLASDVAYNATLGSHFLGEQIGKFDGSYILTFAAYNAGPSRARDWIDRFGDPRGKSIDDVVDWVERIPYNETRNYVQRVMENYEVYKIRLGAGFDIEKDLRFGRSG